MAIIAADRELKISFLPHFRSSESDGISLEIFEKFYSN